MDWILGHTDLVAGALVYVVWEFWLGRTNLLKQNSTAELVLEIIYKAIGKILGKVDAQATAAAPTQLSDADKAIGLK
jgi:hypothetical protein